MLRYITLLFQLSFLIAQNGGLVYDESKTLQGKLLEFERIMQAGKDAPVRKILTYFKSSDYVEEIVLYEKSARFVEMTFNWNYMMIEKGNYMILGYKEEFYEQIEDWIIINMGVDVNLDKQSFDDHLVMKGEEEPKGWSETISMKGTPYVFYTYLFHMDLCNILRFFPFGNRKEIEFYEYSKGINVKMIARYMGIEKIDVPYGSVLCHKLDIKPDGFIYRMLAKGITIWLSAEDNTHYMVKYQNENSPLDSATPRVEYRLSAIKPMTDESWEALKTKYAYSPDESR